MKDDRLPSQLKTEQLLFLKDILLKLESAIEKVPLKDSASQNCFVLEFNRTREEMRKIARGSRGIRGFVSRLFQGS